MSSVKNPRKIFVSNVAKDVREKDLYRLFSEVGKISRVQYKSNFAFIEYDESYSAEQAIKKFHTMEFKGRRLTIEPYCYRGGDSRYRPSLLDGRRSRSHDRSSSRHRRHHHHSTSSGGTGNYRIIVTGLETNTSWQDLKDFGRTGGRSVTFADVYARRGLKEGIIEYFSYEDFANALKTLDDSRLNGVRVRVYDEKEYQKRRYHSRSRSRSASHRRASRSFSRNRNRSRSRYHSQSRSRSKDRQKSQDKIRHSRRSATPPSRSHSRPRRSNQNNPHHDGHNNDNRNDNANNNNHEQQQ